MVDRLGLFDGFPLHLKIGSGIAVGRGDAGVAKPLADRKDVDPRSQQMYRSAEGNAPPGDAMFNPLRLDHFWNASAIAVALKHTRRRHTSQKDFAKIRVIALEAASEPSYSEMRTASAQVFQQRRGDFVSEGQPKQSSGLALLDTDASGPPCHIVQRKCHNVAPAQAVGGDQEKDRIIPDSGRSRAIDGLQERLNGLPWQRFGKFLFPIDARRVDLSVEACRGLPGRRHEPQESSNVRHHALERRSL